MPMLSTNLVTTVVCTLAVIVFSAFIVPSELEAEGKGRMPRKFGIRALFAMAHVLLFFILVFGIHFGANFGLVIKVLSGEISVTEISGVFVTLPDPARAVGAARGSAGLAGSELVTERMAKPIFGPLEPNTVVTASALFFGLFGLGRWRKIEAGVLRQLQNVSMIEDDVRKLAANLRECAFHPKPFARRPAAAALYRLQRRISEVDAGDHRTSLAVKWAKLETLLHLWREEQAWGLALPANETPTLEAARTAHERKSRLALKIEMHVEKVERGEGDPTVLAELSDQLRRDSDAALQTLHAGGGVSGDGSLSDDRSLQELLRPLLEYFAEEYDELLGAWSRATAKSVMLAGDGAEERLQTLDEHGFSGIGEFSPIELHRALLIAVSVFFGLLTVFYVVPWLLSLVMADTPRQEGPFVFVLSFSLTLATVLGAMVGGLRILAKARSTPWGWYILAAIAIAITHSILSFVAISYGIGPTEAPGHAGPSRSPAFYVIVGVIPFSLVLGICWLGRQTRPAGRLPQPLVDAGSLAAILACAGVMLILMADQLGVPPPRPGLTIPERMIIVSTISAAIGAVVGALVIRHVRAAALSSVVRPAEPGGWERQSVALPKPDLSRGVQTHGAEPAE